METSRIISAVLSFLRVSVNLRRLCQKCGPATSSTIHFRRRCWTTVSQTGRGNILQTTPEPRLGSSDPAALSYTAMSTTTGQAVLGGGDLTVHHDDANHEFYITLDHDKAILQYEEIGDGKVDLYHTLVPPAFRRRGIAKLLAQAALDHFASKSTPMVLSCPYLQKFVKDQPQTHHLQHIVSS